MVKDLRGIRFGRLTVVQPGEPVRRGKTGPKRAVWQCRCDCGRLHEVPHHDLIKGSHTSCGMCSPQPAGALENRPDAWIETRTGRKRDLSGWIVGDLTVIEEAEASARPNDGPLWRCKCICGAEVVRSIKQLYYGGRRPSCSDRAQHARNLFLHRTFGQLTVIDRHGARWLCKCSCGQQKVVAGVKLTRGLVQSCDNCRSTKRGGSGVA